MFTRKFWRETAERAGKSAAQAAILALGSAASVDALAADWRYVGSMALGGAALSALTSLASARVGSDDSPSLVS